MTDATNCLSICLHFTVQLCIQNVLLSIMCHEKNKPNRTHLFLTQFFQSNENKYESWLCLTTINGDTLQFFGNISAIANSWRALTDFWELIQSDMIIY